MRRRTRILVAASMLAVGALAWPMAFGETKAANESQKVEELLKERQATLRQLVELVTAEYGNGQTGFDSVVRAADQLLAADLEFAENAKTRIAILQKRVELMKSLFSMAESRFKHGVGSQTQVLAARAAMLESQSNLLGNKLTLANRGSEAYFHTRV